MVFLVNTRDALERVSSLERKRREMASILTDRAMLVSLSISRWTANKSDKNLSNQVAADHNADPDMLSTRRRLVAKARLDVIREIGARARHHHYECTLPWLDDGARILPAASYFDYMAKQNAFESEFNYAVEDFVIDYPMIVDQAKLSLNGLFNPADYPDSASIRKKFSMACTILALPSKDDFRVALGEQEQERVKEQIELRLADAANGAVADVWQRVHERVERMVERLRGYSVDANGKVQNAFRDSLVENIRELATNIMPALNITNNNRLEDMRQRLLDDLCQIDAGTLREDSTVRDDIAAKAESILADIQSVMV